jgi:hypothetical protein
MDHGVQQEEDEGDEKKVISNIQTSYFQPFAGNTECGISLPDLYLPPPKNDEGVYPPGSFCPNRETLLEAMTGGGRHGFDAPFFPKGTTPPT